MIAVQGDSGRSRCERCCAGASPLCTRCGAFFVWLWTLAPSVRRWIHRRGAPVAVVDDVMSEVFTVAWRRLDLVPGEASRAERWLCAVARRALSNQRRAMAREARRIEVVRAHRVVLDQQRVGPGFPGPERVSLFQAWRSLPTEDAEILQLVGWAGFGLDQLAERLGCRRGAAAMRLSRARQRLESLISV